MPGPDAVGPAAGDECLLRHDTAVIMDVPIEKDAKRVNFNFADYTTMEMTAVPWDEAIKRLID